MSKNTRIIILSVLAVLIVIVLSIGITTAFMKPVEQGGNLTEISLSSCAKIKLTGTSSVNLSNSYPMSRNRGLQTTPYSLTVTSYCDSYVGFNLYIATLNTNTLTDENIHYILTSKGSKDVIVEGLLSDATNGVSDFDDASKTELNAGLKGTYGNIYKIYNDSMSLKGNEEYDLYLFVDENATNTTMGKTFSAGVAVKAYDREKATINEVCSNGDNLASCVISFASLGSEETAIYRHDGSLENGINDNSYRYAGAPEQVNNFVCFGSTTKPCPTDNLYKIIGVIDGKVKLIKYDYANSNLLGTDGDYYGSSNPSTSYYKGNLTSINTYYWNYKAANSASNEWSTSLLNKTNLNTNFINNIGSEWANKIATTTWKVGGNTWANIGTSVPKTSYQNEIVAPAENTTDNATTYSAKIGLMYVSDYGFAASPEAWTITMNLYNNTTVTNNNWMYMGLYEWTISSASGTSDNAFLVDSDGGVGGRNVTNRYGVRPSFSLSSSITYVSGSGSMSDPIRVN